MINDKPWFILLYQIYNIKNFLLNCFLGIIDYGLCIFGYVILFSGLLFAELLRLGLGFVLVFVLN